MPLPILTKILNAQLIFSLFIVLAVFNSQKVYSQKKQPIAFANTYTLTEADGFPGFNYVTDPYFDSSGKIYIKDFFGNFHITGNNYIKRVYGLNNVVNGSGINKLTKNEYLLFNDKTITIIKNDSVVKTVEFPYADYLPISPDFAKRHFNLRPRGDSIEVYEFKTDNWQLVNKAAWNKDFVFTKFPAYIYKDENIYLLTELPQNKRGVYLFDTSLLQLRFINTIPKDHLNNSLYPTFYDNQWKFNKLLKHSFANFYMARIGKQVTENMLKSISIEQYFGFQLYTTSFQFNYQNGCYEYGLYNTAGIQPNSFVFEAKNKLTAVHPNPYCKGSFLALTGNKPMRIFSYLQKYPYIFNHNNSSNIFALAQDDLGRIWAGNYEFNVSIISQTHTVISHSSKQNEQSVNSSTDAAISVQKDIIELKQLPKQPYRFMNASFNYHHKLYFLGETFMGGLLCYDSKGNLNRPLPQIPTGFYLYYAPKNKKLFIPSAGLPNRPIYSCSVSELEKPFIHWQKLDSTVGILPYGFSTITEDSLGRIWCGHPKKGFAVYNPYIKKAITYDASKKETPIGFISCLTDNKGTVFMGSDDKGLWYYNDYTKPPTPQNIHNIYHPLLNGTVRITSMCIYKNWLVMGCYNKICLLNLDSFYIGHKTIVRYLNPQESNFSSFTEQNTMLVSKTDSSIWFSTGDMLYNWDIKTWLQLSPYKVNLAAFLQTDSIRKEFHNNDVLNLPPGFNSFTLLFEYTSKDGLPRYTRSSLVKEGDSIRFTEPNLISKFNFQNLSSGRYNFYIDVFEQDGSISNYTYCFVIEKYIWQNWWFWVIVSIIFLTPFILWLNTLRKKAIQQKQISQLNAVAIASQFRPHFILNVLNTIGAELKDKPAAESVISRLGESINLIFSHSKQKTINHSFKNEWALVINVIQIHKVMYLPDLQVQIPEETTIEHLQIIQVPIGIMEIFVENALLHGLRNKKYPPYILNISIQADDSFIFITIKDNGIGRENASLISSYKKNGSGIKTVTDIITLLNLYNHNKIEIEYIDENDPHSGTSVRIKLPKEYNYEL